MVREAVQSDRHNGHQLFNRMSVVFNIQKVDESRKQLCQGNLKTCKYYSDTISLQTSSHSG